MTADAARYSTAKPRRAWLAALLSLFWPGTGQLYNGDGRRAFVAFGGAVVPLAVVAAITIAAPPALPAVAAVLAGVLLIVAVCFGAAIDALRRARRLGATALKRYQRVWIYLASIVLAIVITEIARYLVGWHPYSTPSGSMMPTLQLGDLFMAARGYFRRHEPQRGDDLAVFRGAIGGRTVDFVKRIVALPGDRVQLRAGVVYINGAPIARERIDDFTDPDIRLLLPQFVETGTDGRSYRVLNLIRGSASMGFVARAALTDRPYLIYWSRSLQRIGTPLQ
jgi:signal peptidase I